MYCPGGRNTPCTVRNWYRINIIGSGKPTSCSGACGNIAKLCKVLHSFQL